MQDPHYFYRNTWVPMNSGTSREKMKIEQKSVD